LWDAEAHACITGTAGQLATRGLLALLQPFPLQLTTLLLCACHAAACGCLPAAVDARLGRQQAAVALDAAAFGRLSGAAGAAADGAVPAAGLQLAGRLLQAAVRVCEAAAAAPPAGATAAAAAAGSADEALARASVCSSVLALQPYWQQLGVAQHGAAALPTMLPVLQLLLQPASAHHRLLAHGVQLCCAATSTAAAASGAALAIAALLNDQQHDAAPQQAAQGQQPGGHTSCEPLVFRSHALSAAVAAITAAAHRQSSQGDSSSPAAGSAPADDAVRQGVLLFCLADELAKHVSAAKQQEVWAALAAAAPEAAACAAAAGSTRTSEPVALPVRSRLLQHVLGAAASGLVCAALDEHQAGTGAGAAAQPSGSSSTRASPVELAARLLQQAAPEPSQVRAAYSRLLDSLAATAGLTAAHGLLMQPQREHEQQEQQEPAGPAAAGAAETAAGRAVLLQRCLARINWAGYEAAVGATERAAAVLTDALAEAQRCGQPCLAGLVQGCSVGLAAWPVLRAGQHAAESAHQQQQQQQQQQALQAGVAAAAAGSEGLVWALHAALRSPALLPAPAPALQHPALTYADDAVAQHLAPRALPLPHPVLGPSLGALLAALPRRQVRACTTLADHAVHALLLESAHVVTCVAAVATCSHTMLQVVLLVELLTAQLPACPALLQQLLPLAGRFPGDKGWLAWLLPLLVACCCNSRPAAPARGWAAVVLLARRVSCASAAALARLGAQAHPWSLQLWQLHADTQGACAGGGGGGVVGARTCWPVVHVRGTDACHDQRRAQVASKTGRRLQRWRSSTACCCRRLRNARR
jgi:hypothetical protein